MATGTYTLTAKVYDNLGASTVSAPVTVTVATASLTSASFVGTDTTTQGNWQGVYGADGYNVVNNTASYPSYAVVTPGGQANWTWATSTIDPRGLQQGADPSARIAACWYAPTSFTIDVNLTDGNPHTLAVYTVDWDSTTRAVSLTVRDASSGAVLDTETVSSFNSGRYTIWQITGHVMITVTQTGQTNAVVSGLFFDP